MRHPLLTRVVASFALTAGGLAFLPTTFAENSPAEIAESQSLRNQAYTALAQGDFVRSGELIKQAEGINTDPQLAQIGKWLGDFEVQRGQLNADRKKAYDEAVADVKKLQDGGFGSYAIDVIARAYTLAPDKTAFRKEAWVDELVNHAVADAGKSAEEHRWINALRLYSDLSQVEPANPTWKVELKNSTRRVRLLAMYTPEVLKEKQKLEYADRDKVEALLSPTTKPATQPADREENEAFKLDWNDTLKGVKMAMLRESLEDARDSYWRNVALKDLLSGGINGVRAIASTEGLEKAFPSIGDAQQRDAFLKQLNDLLPEIDKGGPNEKRLIGEVLRRVTDINSQTLNLPEEVLVSEFADGALAELDPFSNVIWPQDVAEFNKSTQGSFTGVGIQIQLDDNGDLKVVSPLEDSPAYRAGIGAGDVVTQIDGKSAKGITTNQAIKAITGQRGTKVTLTVKSESGEVKEYRIQRDIIKVASTKGWLHSYTGGWDYFVDAQSRIGYVRLTSFTKDTSRELNAALDQLKKQDARGLIIDLRANPGGLLTAATEVVDRFIPGGVIVSTQNERGLPNQPAIEAKASADDVTIPLVVLVNQYSASASEIVSGALKDHKRALIIGERTFGKGSVQMLFPLSTQDSLLKLTTSHYYLPSNRCIHREENSTEWGVDPNVSIEMTPEQMRNLIKVRQEMDVLRDKQPNDPAAAVTASESVLKSDPQLSAALLLLRVKLADGATS